MQRVGNERVPTNMEQKTILASMKPENTKRLSFRVEVATRRGALPVRIVPKNLGSSAIFSYMKS